MQANDFDIPSFGNNITLALEKVSTMKNKQNQKEETEDISKIVGLVIEDLNRE